MSENKTNKRYTILLVGEAGVGKATFLQLIANVLVGNDTDHYDFDILEHYKEQNGPTDSVHVYKVTSNNRIEVSDSVYERGE
jgi:tRNA A37 threonylcarbamoyladenosine biosynthesis protein TsaE